MSLCEPRSADVPRELAAALEGVRVEAVRRGRSDWLTELMEERV